MTSPRPLAIRAIASVRPSLILRRPRRVCYYDAFWPNGWVQRNISPSALMYQRDPADYSVFEKQLHAACPEVGVGSWIDYFGSNLDAVIGDVPVEPPTGLGRRVDYEEPGVPRPDHSRRRRTQKLGVGASSLIVGGALIILNGSTGFLAFIGLAFCMAGLALLSTSWRRPR
jgi:hypothetical protein